MKRNLRFLFSTLLMLVCSVVGMAATGDTYKLVTNASELQSGDMVVIASGNSAIGAANGDGTKIDPTTVSITDGVLSYVDGLGEIVLEGSTGNWYMKYVKSGNSHNGQYISLKDNTGHSLKMTDSQTDKVSISVSSDGNSTIKYSRGIYRYFGIDSNFGVYSSRDVQIYKKQRRANGLSFAETSYTNDANVVDGTARKVATLNNPNNLDGITYSSSDNSVATANADGTVTFNHYGKATITATFGGNANYEQGSVSYTVEITALNAEIGFASESMGVYADAKPFNIGLDNEHNLTIAYSSSNTNIATIDNEGVVTIKKWGDTNITATFAGNEKYAPATATLPLSVSAVDPKLATIYKSATLTINSASQKVAVLNPNNLPLTYTSSTPYVATVDADGMLTFVSCGETTITATFAGDNVYGEGTSVSYQLTVVGQSNYDYTPVEFIAGTDKGSTTNTNNSDEMTKQNVTITSPNAAFASSPYELKYNHSLDIKVSKGRIVRVEVEGDIKNLGQGNNGGGNYYKLSNSKHIWAGSSKIVSLKASAGRLSEKISAIRVYVEYPDEKTVVYNENEANAIEKWENTNITLNRTFTGSQWNTICLPFDLSKNELEGVFGDNTKLVAYDSESDNTVLFKTVTNGIEAGKPYLIKPVNTVSTWTYNNMDVKVEEPTAVGANIKFQGIFSPKDITENGTVTAAGVTAGGNIATAKPGDETKAFRAYFTFADATANPQAVKLMIDGSVTSIGSIDADTTTDANAPVYNIQGQRVNGASLTKGVYVKNGRKFVVTK